jgi:4-hydroxy-3-polyprenylbenzoate decarboxylase
MPSDNKNIAVIMTGASGSVYGLRLVEKLLQTDHKVALLVSDAGLQVLKYETGIDWERDPAVQTQQVRKHFNGASNVICYANNDFFAPIASGSAAPDATVIVPCSMGTLGRVAAGLSGTLIERVADVSLKERRELIMVPRETPFNQIHLENLLKLSQAGAHILPAMPAFYQKPETVADMVDFVVGKILDALKVEHDLFQRWGKEKEQS